MQKTSPSHDTFVEGLKDAMSLSSTKSRVRRTSTIQKKGRTKKTSTVTKEKGKEVYEESSQDIDVDIESDMEKINLLLNNKKHKANKKNSMLTRTTQLSKKKQNPKKTKNQKKTKTTAKQQKITEMIIRKDKSTFNPSQIKELRECFPDEYWNELHTGKIFQSLNEKKELKLVASHIGDRGPILGLQVSKDGELLATFSTLGIVKIWDTTTFELLQELYDSNEDNIDEFYVGWISNDNTLVTVGGKLKDRKRWSYDDDDNHILPCPLKIFDTVTGTVIARLEGHEEEILCIKAITFKHENYYLSTSQDGYIIRWHMNHDWKTLISKNRMDDGITCMAFTVSMVPNTGNKYFLGACDEHIRLYDFERCELLQTFSDIYSSYCDCGKFIHYVNQDQEEDQDEGAYFISRGVELLDSENNTIASRPNTCILHKLIFPTSKSGKFQLREIRSYKHEE
jgi:WD40 repeat protein